MPGDVLARAADVRLLILDVDGVLTDGRLYYGPDGSEYKAFHARDGSAMKGLMASGVPIAIITGRKSAAVERRAAELGVPHVFTGAEDKAAALAELAEQSGVDPAHMGHAGDDLADLALFARTGMAFAVPDAHPAVLARADYVTTAVGGAGAVREICDLIRRAQGTWTVPEA
ncbi:MAG: HAD-IIIA family hydrolase [Gammaproteobacteria bacterium]|nr:HAD-IIIA family hydrolase [Gammaproteobacteria bacterium]